MAQQGKILPIATRQAIKEMRANGETVRTVAQSLQINRNTACKYGRTTLGQNCSHGTPVR